MWSIREELPEDRDAVRAVVAAAFGRSDEADLVDRLRAAGEVALALVADWAPATPRLAAGREAAAVPGAAGDPEAADGVREAGIAGHVLFSPLPLAGAGQAVPAAALAPLAVHPRAQRLGVGEALVREGLARLEARGVPAVVVLGDPAYYRRFGFRADLAARLVAPFSGGAFMAIELAPGALSREGLAVRYPSAFGID